MAQSTARVMGPHGGRSSEGSVGVLQRWSLRVLLVFTALPPLNFLTLQLPLQETPRPTSSCAASVALPSYILRCQPSLGCHSNLRCASLSCALPP
eukprot:scaffold112005_cov57-Phaeocystis_antarctica.AAC.3